MGAEETERNLKTVKKRKMTPSLEGCEENLEGEEEEELFKTNEKDDVLAEGLEEAEKPVSTNNKSDDPGQEQRVANGKCSSLKRSDGEIESVLNKQFKPEESEGRETTSSEEQVDFTKVEKAASDVCCEKSPKVSWPWIPLLDPVGRRYYYNALESRTAWTIDENSSEQTSGDFDSVAPPTTSTVASAQKALQNYWEEWQKAQLSKKISPSIPSGAAQVLGKEQPPALRNNHLVSSKQEGVLPGSISIYAEHYRSPTAKELGRPARQQVRPPKVESLGYTQGFEEYNIWYCKHLSDRYEGGRREDREKVLTRCNPFTDSGWTTCDYQPELDRPVICLYFAKGCCYLGSKCRYYHRLATVEDDEKLDMLHDIFGRERFASHREDMDGVGSFSEDCRTLFIGDLKVNRVYPNAEEKTEQLIRQQFGLWGPLEDIRVIRNKNIAFIRYKYRVHAEFAKVAMAEQKLLLDRPDDQICVRWAHPEKASNDKSERNQEWEMANKAMMTKLRAMGYTQEDLECYIRWEIQQKASPDSKRGVTEVYPINSSNMRMTEQLNKNNTGGQNLENSTDASIQESSPEFDPSQEPISFLSPDNFKMEKVLSRISEIRSSDAFVVDV